MHVYGVGSAGNIGSSVSHLLNKKYNKGRGRRSGQSFDHKTVNGVLNAQVTQARLRLESNHVSKIKRPYISVDAEIGDVWGALSDKVDHVSFLPENRPSLSYHYPLHDEEIKGLIDAGMYSNPRFEALMNKLMEREEFEITHDVDVQSLDVLKDDAIVPLILVKDVGDVTQSEREDEYHTTFGSVIERTIDMAKQLEAEGIASESVIGDDEELELDEEIEVDVADVFNSDSIADSLGIDDELDALEDDQDEDEDLIDMDDIIEVSSDSLFGQTSEEARIEQMKEASSLGIDSVSAEIDDDDVLGDLDEEDDYDYDDLDDQVELDMIEDDDEEIVLTDAEEINLDEAYNYEDDDEDELEL